MSQIWIQNFPSFLRKRLKEDQNLQRIVGNTGWLFADKGIRVGGELTVGIWLARYLGPEQFGLLTYALAFVSLFSALATLGLNKIVVRDMVRQPELQCTTLGTAFILRLVAGGLTAGAVIVSIALLRPNDQLSQWLVGLIAVGLIFQASDVITFWFQSQVQAKHDILARCTAYLMTCFAKVGLILLNASVLFFGVILLMEVMLRAAGLGIVYQSVGRSLRTWKFSLSRAKDLLQDSWPLILSGLAVTIYMRIDQIMLGQMANDDAVGIYSAAVRLSESWYFVPVAIASSTFPMVLEAKAISQERYLERIRKLFRAVIGVTYLIILPLTFLAQPLVTFLLGQSYVNSGTVLSIHIWSGVFVSLGVIRELWMTTENLLRFSFMTTLSGALLNVTLNYILIPQYEAIGAAIATLISYICAAFLSCFLFKKTRPIAQIMLAALVFR